VGKTSAAAGRPKPRMRPCNVSASRAAFTAMEHQTESRSSESARADSGVNRSGKVQANVLFHVGRRCSRKRAARAARSASTSRARTPRGEGLLAQEPGQVPLQTRGRAPVTHTVRHAIVPRTIVAIGIGPLNTTRLAPWGSGSVFVSCTRKWQFQIGPTLLR